MARMFARCLILAATLLTTVASISLLPSSTLHAKIFESTAEYRSALESNVFPVRAEGMLRLNPSRIFSANHPIADHHRPGMTGSCLLSGPSFQSAIAMTDDAMIDESGKTGSRSFVTGSIELFNRHLVEPGLELPFVRSAFQLIHVFSEPSALDWVGLTPVSESLLQRSELPRIESPGLNHVENIEVVKAEPTVKPVAPMVKRKKPGRSISARANRQSAAGKKRPTFAITEIPDAYWSYYADCDRWNIVFNDSKDSESGSNSEQETLATGLLHRVLNRVTSSLKLLRTSLDSGLQSIEFSVFENPDLVGLLPSQYPAGNSSTVEPTQPVSTSNRGPSTERVGEKSVGPFDIVSLAVRSAWTLRRQIRVYAVDWNQYKRVWNLAFRSTTEDFMAREPGDTSIK